jgi:DNA mismatch repair ATPase MutS
MQAALQQTSNALAELDAVLSLASVAVDLGLVRPVLVADNVIVIKVIVTLLHTSMQVHTAVCVVQCTARSSTAAVCQVK